MKKTIILTIYFSFLFIVYSIAQTSKNFTADNDEKFLEELKSFMESEDKSKGREFMESFTMFWNGGKVDKSDKDFVVKTCNSLLKKRMKSFPDFSNFFSSFMAFYNTQQSPQSYAAWKKSVETIINGKSQKKLPEYFQNCALLFSDRMEV